MPLVTSRERVEKAIAFQNPDRAPVHCPSLGVSDLHWVRYGVAQGWLPSVPGEDEWGCVWDLSTGDMGQPKGYPLANGDDGSMGQWVNFPAPDAPGRFAMLAERDRLALVARPQFAERGVVAAFRFFDELLVGRSHGKGMKREA
jgi:hypothetical protein